MSWIDKLLDFQEQLLREQMQALTQQIKYTEESLTIIHEVNKSDTDATLADKSQRFREYLQKLKQALHEMQDIKR